MHPHRGIRCIQRRLKIAHPGSSVMVAAIHQQANPQLQIAANIFRRQPPGDIAGVGARFQPDALFQHDVADREAPNRHPPFQPERFEVYVTGRIDCAAGPAVAEQRDVAVAVHQSGVGLGEHQPAIQRRMHRRDQQAVITPGQSPGHRAGGVPPQPVRQPPFAPLGLRQIAANRPATADKIR